MIQLGHNFHRATLIVGCLCSLITTPVVWGDTATGGGTIVTDLYSILASPTSFDGKLVDVSGFICMSADNSALLFSYRYCVKSDGKVGVGLLLNADHYKKREEFGHKSYGEVIGVVHTLKPNQVWVDNGLGNIWITVDRITAKSETFVWSHDVTAPLSQSEPAYSETIGITQALLDSVKHKSYSKLARIFSPRNDEMMMAYEKDFKNPEKRLNWVFFSAPHSINSALNAPGDLPTKIEVYETKESGEYLACTTIGTHMDSFQPGLDFLLRGGNKFCFTIFHHDLITDADFEND
jgi:hypothetical protein